MVAKSSRRCRQLPRRTEAGSADPTRRSVDRLWFFPPRGRERLLFLILYLFISLNFDARTKVAVRRNVTKKGDLGGGRRGEKNKTAAKFHSTLTDTAAIFGTTERLTAGGEEGAEPAGRPVLEEPVRGGPLEFSL